MSLEILEGLLILYIQLLIGGARIFLIVLVAIYTIKGCKYLSVIKVRVIVLFITSVLRVYILLSFPFYIAKDIGLDLLVTSKLRAINLKLIYYLLLLGLVLNSSILLTKEIKRILIL